ncbi:MAG: response regulator, partial [Anaerolineales bacterium]|nr:response regulator [Anaerolineales bacterium]
MKDQLILIVEDERAVARSIDYALRNEGFQTLIADTGARALELTSVHNPQLILLDIRLPDISGFDVCRQLRAEGKRMPLLMVTARDEEVDKVLGLELGADDYIVKPYSLRELISRVRAQLRRSYGEFASTRPERTFRVGAIEFDLERFEVTRNDETISLTPTEMRLLRHLIENPNRPVSRSALIEAVWGYDSEISDER